MARNYTIAEAARIVREGTDKVALIDLGKKFPLTMLQLAKLNEVGFNFVAVMPEKVTTRKIEMILRGDVEVDEESENEKPEVDETTDMPAPKSWKSMSQYQKTKARTLGAEYVAACKKLDEDGEDAAEEEPAKEEKKAPKKAAKKPVVEDEDDDEDNEEEEEVKPAKKSKKPEKKASKKEEKKPAKKAKKVEEEEDDDDFDDFDFDDDDDE